MKLFSAILILFISFSNVSIGQQAQLTKEYKTFDFWLGEWDVFGNGSKVPTAQSSIVSILDSFAIQENYSVINNPYKGKSLNKYNPNLNRWEQFWVDNSGTSLFIYGNLDEKGRMVMSNETIDAEGIKNQNEISWQKLENGDVLQTWRLKRGNNEWNILFRGIYKRKS